MQTLGFVTRALLLLLVLGTSSTTAVNANVSEHTSSSSSSNNEVQSSPPEYRVASHTAAPLHAAISDAATTVNATTTATTTVSSDNNNNSSTGAAAAATAPAPLSATDAAWVHDTAQLAQLIYELDGAQPGVTALDITQVGRPPAVQAYTELPFGQTFELTYNFSAPEYLESLTGSLPKQARQQIVIALHSPGFVQERKTPMFAALLAHQRPRMIVMAATHPASSLPFYHALNVTAPHQHRLDPSYNPRHLLHYWNNKLCVDGYALNVYKTVVARNALAQRPLHHNTYRLLSFRLAIYEAADMYGSTSVDHDAVRLASMSVHDPLLSLHFSRLVHDSERQAILDEHDEYRYVVHKAQTELLSRQLSARSGLSSSCRKTHAPGDIRICDASTDRPVHLCALSIAPEVVVDSKLRADLWMQLYRDQWHDKLAVLMARDLEQQCDRIKAADDVSVATLQTVTIENNEFLRVFLHLLAQTDFRPHRRHQYRLLHDQHRLSILVRLSDVGSTDVYLHDSLALWSFLMLYNPMSRHQVPLVRLYDRDVLLTAAWLSNLYSAGLEGLISYAPTLRWLRRYVVGVDPRHRALADSVFGGTYDWVLDYETGFHLMNAPSGYFAISYIDADQDRWYKHGINHMLSNVLRAPLIREWSRERFPVARPDARGRPRIAVISKFWSGSHASVRILRGTLAALKPHASITLVLLDALEQVEWKEYFDDLHVVRCMPNVDLYADDVNWIVEQNFAMVYYLDVRAGARA